VGRQHLEVNPVAGRLRGAVRSEYLVLYLSLVYFAALAPFTPGFASTENLKNVLSSMLPLLVVAAGQTVVLITGGIDLSVTAIIGLTSTAGALALTRWELPAPLAVAVMLACGLAVGLINGAAITALRMPPFIVTLATMMFFGGFAIWLTQSRNIYRLSGAFTIFGRELVLSFAVTAGVCAAADWMLRRTVLGRWLYAAGRSVRTSLASGVPVRETIVCAYTISGVYAAIASVLYTGRLETGSPVMGQRIFLDVIGATVIGGTSLFGGSGKILWTAFGVLFMTLVDNSLNLLGLTNFAILIVKGLIILGAAILDTVRSRYA
jgi:ribose transport system permease protein